MKRKPPPGQSGQQQAAERRRTGQAAAVAGPSGAQAKPSQPGQQQDQSQAQQQPQAPSQDQPKAIAAPPSAKAQQAADARPARAHATRVAAGQAAGRRAAQAERRPRSGDAAAARTPPRQRGLAASACRTIRAACCARSSGSSTSAANCEGRWKNDRETGHDASAAARPCRFASRCWLLLSMSPGASAQTRAWLDRDRIGAGETVTLNIETDVGGGRVPDYTPLQRDFVLSGHTSRRAYDWSTVAAARAPCTPWRCSRGATGVITIPPLRVGSERTQPLTPAGRGTQRAGAGARRRRCLHRERSATTTSPTCSRRWAGWCACTRRRRWCRASSTRRAPEGASLQRVGDDAQLRARNRRAPLRTWSSAASC